ncbi:hypothetical protein [Endozoicomonas sp. Mp262]|uniref:hypothetical protein n=1 Tax=Endozoicomonas sp. Mp262 TaxID=2919499 RepID=UPI0021DA8457
MEKNDAKVHQLLEEEISKIPGEYLPALLTIVHTFRESVSLGSAEDSFKKGWEEALEGHYKPVEDLWKGLDH